jgi:glycosyltransferase involved in cell wall biosynthesis
MARIVHVSESLATGVLSVLATLAHAQTRDGHEVILLGSTLRADTPPAWREMLPKSLHFIHVPMVREIRPWNDAQGIGRLWVELRRARPDVVHLHSSKAGALGRVAVAGLPRRARVVYQPHGLAYLRSDVSGASRRAYEGVERLLAMLGGTVVACSEGEREALASVVPASRRALVTNGIDLSNIPQATLRATRLRIGTCGRVSPQKRPAFFAEVARELRDAADFVWIGDGDAGGKDALRAAGVHVTGWCPREEAQRQIATLQVYVQTSAWEGMPISVIEAMAAGLPVVATDVVGNRDLLAGTSAGALVESPAGMIGALAEFVESLEKRERAGAAARELATRMYSADIMVRSFYRLYGVSPRADTPAAAAVHSKERSTNAGNSAADVAE